MCGIWFSFGNQAVAFVYNCATVAKHPELLGDLFLTALRMVAGG